MYPKRSTALIERLEDRRLFTAIALPYSANPYIAGQTIEAENFDRGGEGVAYHNPNLSAAKSTYRTDTNIVITKAVGDQSVNHGASNLRYVSNTLAGEWLQYTVTIPTSGNYVLAARVANNNPNGQFHVAFDGSQSTDEITIPRTPTSTNWRTVTENAIHLDAGTHTFRMKMDVASKYSTSIGNFDWFQLIPMGSITDFNFQAGAASTLKQFEARSAVVGGKLYSFGGYTAVNEFGANESFQVFDPETNVWTNLGSMPIPETHSGIAADESTGMIYFVGGLFGLYPGTATNQVWSYDTVNNIWAQLPSLPKPMAAGSSAIVDGELHYIGGEYGQQRNVDQKVHLVLDLDDLADGTATWKNAAPLPELRDHLSTVALDGKIYAFGGQIGHDTYHLQQNHCFYYDPDTDSWTRITDMPIPCSHAEGGTFALDGKIIVAGGQVDDFLGSNSVLGYDPDLNRWFELGNLPTIIEGATVLPVGDELVFSGGYDGISGVATNRTYIAPLPEL